MDKTARRFLLGLICACTFASCEKIFDHNAVVEDTDSLAESAYPVDRLITDSKGRSIDVSITGRGLTHVNFRKKSDNKSFELPLKQLSDRDQTFIKALPITDTGVPKLLEPETLRYVKVREGELKELLEQKAKLRDDLDTRNNDEIKSRSLRRDIELLEPKIERLEKQIATYWKQNPPK